VCVLYINKGKGVKRGEKEETMDGVALSLSLSLDAGAVELSRRWSLFGKGMHT
jgi:hypothetical protein